MDTENNSININSIFQLIFDNFKLLFCTTLIILVLALIYVINQPNIYTAEAILVPSKYSNSQSSGGGSEFGAIIGEFTGGGGASSRPVSPTVMLLKIFETKDFFEKYYNDDEFLKNLAAPVKYNKDSQTIKYDDEKIDKDGEWKSGEKPLFEAAFQSYLSTFNVDHNRLDNFIKISVDHISPIIAKEWLEMIINDANLILKDTETSNAIASSAFFQSKIENANSVELKALLSNRLVEEYETILLAEITDEFAIRYIDYPRVPDRKSKPSRFMMLLIIMILASILQMIILLMLNSYGKRIEFRVWPFKLKIVSKTSYQHSNL